MKVLWYGLALTALVAAAVALAWGRAALGASLVFGTLASVIQWVSVSMVKRAGRRPFGKFMLRWGIGVGLRLGGVVVFAAAVMVRPETFPPVPAALGYLGVLIPLLLLEPYFLK